MTKLKVYVWKGDSGCWHGDIAPARVPGSGERACAYLSPHPRVASVKGTSQQETVAKGLALLEELLTAELERQDP